MALETHVPRILLTGKDGQVGFALKRALSPLGEMFAIGRADCDLADPQALRAAIAAIRPDVIVNPAAYTAVDKAEREREAAFAVNAVCPGVLAEEAAKTGALLVHYSTDYVFDGRKQGAYSEQDVAAPLSVYGMSKLAGEDAIRRCGGRYLIVRTSWVFGVHGENFLKKVVRLAGERDSLRIVADQVGAPTSSALVADVTAEILAQYFRGQGKPQDPARFGTFHLAAAGETSQYDYARSIVLASRQMGIPLKLSPEDILPISTGEYPLPASRPANSRLDTEKLRSTFNIVLPHWMEDVTDVLRQLNQLKT
jgi:dTDP-4-dehydrorhamnose reductase